MDIFNKFFLQGGLATHFGNQNPAGTGSYLCEQNASPLGSGTGPMMICVTSSCSLSL